MFGSPVPSGNLNRHQPMIERHCHIFLFDNQYWKLYLLKRRTGGGGGGGEGEREQEEGKIVIVRSQ